MKKLLATLLALCLMMGAGAALTEENAEGARTLYVVEVSEDGENWIGVADIGLEMSLVLHEDKTLTFYENGEEDGRGTWEEKDGSLLMTVEEESITLTPLEGTEEFVGALPSGEQLKLSATAPEALVLPALKEAGTLEEFDGVYRLYALGIPEEEGEVTGFKAELIESLGLDFLLGDFGLNEVKIEGGMMTVGEASDQLVLKDGQLIKEGDEALSLSLTENGICLNTEMAMLYYEKAE